MKHMSLVMSSRLLTLVKYGSQYLVDGSMMVPTSSSSVFGGAGGQSSAMAAWTLRRCRKWVSISGAALQSGQLWPYCTSTAGLYKHSPAVVQWVALVE